MKHTYKGRNYRVTNHTYYHQGGDLNVFVDGWAVLVIAGIIGLILLMNYGLIWLDWVLIRLRELYLVIAEIWPLLAAMSILMVAIVLLCMRLWRRLNDVLDIDDYNW